LIAAAGELATVYGLTGWKPNEAENAVRICFESWLQSFGADGSKEERDLLQQVRAYFVEFGDSRFEPVTGERSRPIHKRTGFWRQAGPRGEDREYIVPRELFAEVCDGYDTKASVDILARHGWLVGKHGRKDQSVRLPGMNQLRVYVFGPKMFDDE
jgi:putative DNA primase/helicase